MIVAILFFVTAIIGRWRYPLIATALLIVSAIVVGVGYPWVVNTFQVRPNQLALESEYYQRGIDMTQDAYGIDGLEKSDFEADDRRRAGPAARGRRHDRADPHHGPRGHQPDGPSARAVPLVLPVPGPARRRPLRDRRRVAGHGRLGARAQHGSARCRGIVAEHDARLHARLRHRGGQGQRPHDRRRPGVPRARHPGDGLPLRPGGLRAPRVLRRVLADVLDRRRARGHRPGRARLPVGRRRRERDQDDVRAATAGRASAASSTA